MWIRKSIQIDKNIFVIGIFEDKLSIDRWFLMLNFESNSFFVISELTPMER